MLSGIHGRRWTRAVLATLYLAGIVSVSPFTFAGPTSAATAIDGALEFGMSHTCALDTDSAVWCWGFNVHGVLGNGSYGTWVLDATRAVGVSRAADVAAGNGHSCALLGNGSVQCWGANGEHQLGNATAFVSLLATNVAGINDAVAIDSATDHTCVIRADTTASCWGYNRYGQLGNGSTDPSSVPVQVIGLTDIVDLSVGWQSNCAVRDSGHVWCWGSNQYGALGDGTEVNRSSPVQVAGISTAIRVAVGSQFACAVLDDSSVKCWGRNDYKQTGSNDTSMPSYAPVSVPGLTNVIRLAAGGAHVCAILSDSTVRCWGGNERGQLGIPFGAAVATPVSPIGIGNVTAVAARPEDTCALLEDGRMMCWGSWALPAVDDAFERGAPGIGNDRFDTAQSITGLPFTDGFDASGATIQPGEPAPSCASSNPESSIWYRYKSKAARNLTAVSVGPKVAVHKGPSVGALTEVGCGNDVDIQIEADASYWLQVFGGPDLGQTHLTLRPTTATPNDDRADATPITSLPFTDVVDTTTATLEPGEPVPSCAFDTPPFSSVWYRYVASSSGQLRLTWSGYQFARVGVFEPTTSGGLVEVACNDPNDYSDFFVEDGHEYLFLVRNLGDTGLLTFNLDSVETTDTVAPNVQVVINPATPHPEYTSSPTVNYFISGNDPHPGTGVISMALSSSPAGPWSWQLYSSASSTWTFSGPDGLKHIYAVVRDGAGNVSSVYDGAVTLDRGLPTANQPLSSVALDATIGATVPIAATVTGQDGLSGIADCDLAVSSNGGLSYSALDCEASAGLTGLTPGSKQYRFRGRTTDGAGNTSSWAAGPVFTVKLLQEGAGAITRTGTWAVKSASNASGGRYLQSSTTNSTVKIKFTGRSIAVIARVGRDAGQAQFTLDSVSQTVDLYSPTTKWRKVVFSQTRASGTHVLVVKVLATRNALSSGRKVVVDATSIVT